MQSFAAGTFKRGLQSLLLKPLPQVLCCQLERLERHVGGRVEIEDQAIGIIDRIDRRTPRMDLDSTHLDYFQQASFILDIEVLVLFPFMPELKRVYVWPQALAWIALIETFAIDAGGAAQQTQRVPGD